MASYLFGRTRGARKERSKKLQMIGLEKHEKERLETFDEATRSSMKGNFLF